MDDVIETRAICVEMLTLRCYSPPSNKISGHAPGSPVSSHFALVMKA